MDAGTSIQDADKRADRFRFASMIVPLLAICCVVIAMLVLLGLVELFYFLFVHHRLFAPYGSTP